MGTFRFCVGKIRSGPAIEEHLGMSHWADVMLATVYKRAVD